MNPSGMRGLGFMAASILIAGAAAHPRVLTRGEALEIYPAGDEPLSDEEFIDAYNSTDMGMLTLPEPQHRARTKGHNHKRVAAYERPPFNTQHELDARERRYEHKTGSSLLDKARRAKGRI